MTATRPKRRDVHATQRRFDDDPLDLITLAIAGLRRWYLVLPIIAVTLGAAYAVDARLAQQIEASGQVLLVAEQSAPAGPILGVDLPSLVAELTTTPVRGALLEGDSELTARVRGRAIELQASGTDEDAVTTTIRRAGQWLSSAVDQGQRDAGVPPLERATLQVPTDVAPTLAPTGETRVVGLARIEESMALRQNPHGPSRETASLLVAIANGAPARAAVAAEIGGETDYQISFRARDVAPLLGIRVVAPNARTALDTFDVVVDLLERELAELEARADVAPDSRTAIERIAPPEEVVDIGRAVERPVAAVLGLGALSAVLLVLLLEARDRGRLRPTDDELRRGGLLLSPPSSRPSPPYEADSERRLIDSGRSAS